MKKYCVDTSGFTNPLEGMPQDIHVTLWEQVMRKITSGEIAVTAEIYQEMTHIQDALGDCVKDNISNLLLEVGDADWPFEAYIEHVARMQQVYAAFIRENVGGKKSTIGLNDLSIVALAKTLALPVVSMEKPKAHQSASRRTIPDICDVERVPHMSFSDFLRAEGIRL